MSEKILVTGGNGFLATHVIQKLLKSKKEYTVVAAVRSQSKADDVLSKLNHPRLSTVIVPDITTPDAFNEVIRSGGFTGIQHVAAPFAFSATTTPEDLVNPGIQSTTSILRAAKLHGPTIKRVVLTASFVGVVDTNKGFWPGGVYNDDSWNPISLEETLKPGNLLQSYFGAKKFAEIAAWDFIRDEKPHFDLVALLPPFIFGKVIHRVDSLASLNTSNAILYNYLSGNLKGESIPDLPAVPYFIDVEDLAEAHVLAYETPEAGGKRLQVTNPQPFSNLAVTKILAARYPERAGVLPTKLDTTKYDENTGLPKDGLFEIDASQANRVLGLKYKSLDASVGELFDSLRELEVKEGKL